MKTRAVLIVFLLWAPALATGQSLYDAPHADARLWCPEDIERFYLEQFANTQREARPASASEVDENTAYRRDGMEYRGDMDSFRDTCYHILRQWPEARKGVSDVMLGWSENGMASHGYDLMVTVWRTIVRERDNLRRELWGISHILPTDDDVENAREAALSRYRERWGSDPVPAPRRGTKLAPGDLPEECDCRWFVAISYESASYRHRVLMVKRGTIFEDWDMENTKVLAFIENSDAWVLDPSPTHLLFLVKRGETRFRFSTHLFQSKSADFRYPRLRRSPGDRFLPIEPLPYSESGPEPHVRFEFEYPLWDEEGRDWLWAEAVLSSSPGALWREAVAAMPVGAALNYGLESREWAGPYTPEDQVD